MFVSQNCRLFLLMQWFFKIISQFSWNTDKKKKKE